ncbi:MAG: type I-E CRISPR-associated protein Cse1/CasA, partial [Acidobacteriota bacterium]
MNSEPLDLLRIPWIGVRDSSNQILHLDLAEALERLGRGEELRFTGLRSYQHQAWFCFLVQLAAMALERAGKTTLDHPAEAWRSYVSDLDPAPTAFHLVVQDLEKPAFFQPPVPEGALKAWRAEDHPDILSVLITAKNFDVKANGFSSLPSLEDWCFALITLQTTEGFMGRGNYGIMRMNGGFASRPLIGLYPRLTWAERFRHDVEMLLARVAAKRTDFGFHPEFGLPLAWCRPWGGEKEECLKTGDLHPYVLEVCRRVRLTSSRLNDAKSLRIQAHVTATKAARIDTGEQGSNLGDPWTPIRRKDSAAFTVSSAGFNYRTVSKILFERGDYAPWDALEFRATEGEPIYAFLQATARGQGKTGGYPE